MLRGIFAGWVVIVALVASAGGQPLAQSVPPDAIVYIGWKGTSQMPPEYAQSHLKAVIEASQFRQLFSQTLPRLSKLLEREEPEAGRVIAALSSIAEPMWNYPTAIYFGGLNLADGGRPVPRLAAFIDAGAEAPALVGRLQQEVARLGPSPVPITVAQTGGVVALVVGELPPINAAAAPANLAAHPAFTAAMAKVRGDGVLTLYVDAEAAWKLIDGLVAAQADPGDQREWATARDALNLPGLRRLAYSGSFDGPDWREDFFVEAPSPRTGVAALLDVRPLADEALAAVPQDSSLVFAARFDLSRVLQEVRAAMRKADARAAAEMEQGLARINERLEIDLEKDLLDPLGDQWAFYAADTVGGDGLMGFCVVNRPDDPGKVDQSLWQLSQLANEAMTGIGGGKITLAFRQFERDGVRVQYLAVPVVSPSWAVKDGNLYIGLYPQVVLSAAQHVAGRGRSILENPRYQAVRRRLGAAEAGWVTFYDMEQRVPAGYSSMLLLLRLYLGMADLVGAQSPAMVMPPLNVIMRHVSPAGAVAWADEQGYYTRQIQPFPGSTSLATSDISSGLIGQQALLASILLPSLNRARETANRVKCASNMRQIGQAMLLYANENRQQYPPDLAALVRTQDVGAEVFACPSSDIAVPAEVRAGGIERIAAWVNDQSAYVYLVPRGTSMNLNPELVVLHEKAGNHGRDGMNLLYADGHVEFLNMPAAQREIDKSRQELAHLSKQRQQR